MSESGRPRSDSAFSAAPLRIGLLGASGRMGRAIDRIASESIDLVVHARSSEGDDLKSLAASGAEVVIDFSTPTATTAFLPLAAASKVPVVIGTTGLDQAAHEAMQAAARDTAIFFASNMSVGIHVLGDLLARAVTMLRDDFDIEIVETHHHHKADSPSGTALTLIEIAEKARGAPASRTHGRSGRPGPRPRSEIGLHAVRGGDVVGDHTIHLLGEGERLEIVHRATSRDVFARGALRAARWLPGHAPRIYGMRDLLG